VLQRGLHSSPYLRQPSFRLEVVLPLVIAVLLFTGFSSLLWFVNLLLVPDVSFWFKEKLFAETS
jgi:hypothetical protein